MMWWCAHTGLQARSLRRYPVDAFNLAMTLSIFPDFLGASLLTLILSPEFFHILWYLACSSYFAHASLTTQQCGFPSGCTSQPLQPCMRIFPIHADSAFPPLCFFDPIVSPTRVFLPHRCPRWVFTNFSLNLWSALSFSLIPIWASLRHTLHLLGKNGQLHD